MATDETTCQECGTTLRSLMTVCPKCGTARGGGLLPPAIPGTDPPAERVLRGGMRLPNAPPSDSQPLEPLFYFSPADEGRRFPLVTRYRVVLIAAAAFLALFLLVVA